MFTNKVIIRILIPGAAVVSEASKHIQNSEKVCRPSELPIYTPEVPIAKQEKEPPSEPGVIENSFGVIRRTLFTCTEEVKAYQRVAIDSIEAGAENVDWLIKYLGEEDNTAPKVGAIAIGGLAGFILGLRGGVFKRTLYTSFGALGMAAVCYPKEAAEYTQIGLRETKKYATIGYNFIYGVKKDDPPLELPTITIPHSISEVWDLATGFGKSNTSVTEETTAGENIKASPAAGPVGAATEVTAEFVDPAIVVSDLHTHSLHTKCHCPIGECLHNPEGKPFDLPSKSSHHFEN